MRERLEVMMLLRGCGTSEKLVSLLRGRKEERIVWWAVEEAIATSAG